jgi:DNA-binding LacI/PurR family transcriptional regulator
MARDTRSGKAPTSRDVAALAGVAQSTVSYVINGRQVAPETRARVEEAMRKLRYQPNAGARTLRTSKTNVIALVVHLGPEDDAVETVPYIDTVIAEARRHDYDVILSTLHEGPEGLIRLARRSICDGFLLMDVQEYDERVITASDLDLPVVLVGRPVEARGLDVVDFDTRRTAHLLVDELAATGHRHVAVHDEPPGNAGVYRFLDDFYTGLRERADRHGMELSIIPLEDDSWNSIAQTADPLLDHCHDRLGIIARTPRITQSIVQLLQSRGLVPGEDVSLVSRCTDEMATSFPRPLTNVSPQPRKLTTLAMQFLFDRLAGSKEPARLQLVEPESVTRRATTVDYTRRS